MEKITEKAAALPLHSRTPVEWGRAVLAEPLMLLADHAFLEQKAANNAMELMTRWPGEWFPGWMEAMTSRWCSSAIEGFLLARV